MLPTKHDETRVYFPKPEKVAENLNVIRGYCDELDRIVSGGTRFADAYEHFKKIDDTLCAMRDLLKLVLAEAQALHELTYGNVDQYVEERVKNDE